MHLHTTHQRFKQPYYPCQLLNYLVCLSVMRLCNNIFYLLCVGYFTRRQTFPTMLVSDSLALSRSYYTVPPPPPPPPENKAVGVMKAGHTFTIEPMISAGEN